jgi:hypothetical protein
MQGVAIMPPATLRASYSFSAPVLRRFNAVVPSGERSKVIELFIEQTALAREKEYERIAEEFETHPDFSEARQTVKDFSVLSTDSMYEY